MLLRTGLILLFYFLFLQSNDAQTLVDKKDNWTYGIESGAGLSFTGINTKLNFLLVKNSNEFFIGPKLVTSDSYLPLQGPWGLNIGYRRHILEKGAWKAFVSLDYQVVFIEPYNPRNLPVNGINNIQEFFFSYGFQFQIGKHFTVGQQIGAGGFIEKTIDVIQDEKNRVANYTGILSLFCNYKFAPKNDK